MSLDVYLEIENGTIPKVGSGIFIRENGQTKEITVEEWNRRNPDKTPFIMENLEELTDEVFHANITHNLGRMADAAGLYECLWRPDENDFKLAKDLILSLQLGLKNLQDNPQHFQQFNPENGWGDYEGLVKFVESYLEACREFPEAKVVVWR